MTLQSCKTLQNHRKISGEIEEKKRKAGMGGRKIEKLLVAVCELYEPVTETPDAKCNTELNSSTHYSLCFYTMSKSCME